MSLTAINIILGNQVNANDAQYSPSFRNVASKKNEAIFDSIIQTWAGYVPEGYNEISYQADKDMFKYSFAVKNASDSEFNISIIWANDWAVIDKHSGMLVNGIYFEQIDKALEYFESLFSEKRI